MGLGLFLVAVVLRGGILGSLDRAREREEQRFGWLRPRRRVAGVGEAGAVAAAVRLGAPVRLTLAGGVRLRISPNGHTAGGSGVSPERNEGEEVRSASPR